MTGAVRSGPRAVPVLNLAASMSRAETREQLFDAIEAAAEVLAASRVSVSEIIADDPGRSRIFGVSGRDEELAAGMTYPTPPLPAKGERVSIFSVADVPPDLGEQLSSVGVRWTICAPLVCDGVQRGTLNIGWPDEIPDVDERVDIAAYLADLIGCQLARIERHQRLEYEAGHDQLTGLVLRSGFEDALVAELERLRTAPDEVSAVLLFDIDRLKAINDTEGHEAGDRMLTAIAERARAVLGPDHIVSRLGGDEFVALLRGGDRDDYERVCRSVVDAVLDRPFGAGDWVCRGSVSLGYTCIDAGTTSARDALRRADAGCYRSKAEGGGTVNRIDHNDRLPWTSA